MLYRAMHWETWHYLAKYIPLAPVWLWYCLRARSMWFFSASNPSLEFGGFEGETKWEMYGKLPPGTFPKTIRVSPQMPFDELEAVVAQSGFTYPFAVKPDRGMMGLMFRKIEGSAQLQRYHAIIPCDYLVQTFVPFELEVSVFYYRFPGKATGTITGFIRKDFLAVRGDGQSTLHELLLGYGRVAFRLAEMQSKHASRLHTVVPEGEIFCLSPALNLSRGGKLVSLAHEKDKRLLEVFDDLTHRSEHLYYGRYDIKCRSVQDLKKGENFSILEFNGCGAEPHHIYGNGYTLLQAYSIIIQHWRILYQISAQNHRSGTPYWRFAAGKRYLANARRHFRLLRRIDTALEV